MINADKTCDQSCEIVSPVRLKEIYAPTQSQNSDGGDEESPVHSHYSSFGDSEFERYCSANSMMGTPSLCSSVGTFQESSELDFVSLGSSGLGDFSYSLESYRLEGEFSRSFRERRLSSSNGSISFSGHKNEDCERKNSFDGKDAVVEKRVIEINDGFNLYNDINNVNRNAVSLDYRNGSEVTTAMDLSTILDEELCTLDDSGGIVRCEGHGDLARVSSSVEAMVVQPSANIGSFEANISGVESNVQAVENCLPALHLLSEEEFERDERENGSDDENTSSRFEHSEGEDSMFGYGTDDDQKLAICNQKNLQIFQEPKGGKGNNILMSSSVAFGSDDWDDFAQETRQLDITSLFMAKKQLGVTNEKEVLDSSSQTDTAFPVGRLQQGEVVINFSGSRTQVQGAVELLDHSKTLAPTDFLSAVEKKHNKEDILIANEDTGVLDDLECYHENQIDSGNSTVEHDPQSRSPFKETLIMESNLREITQHTTSQDFSNDDGNMVSVGQEADNYSLNLDHSSDVTGGHSHFVSTKTIEVSGVGFLDEERFPVIMDQNYTERSLQDMPASYELSQNHQKQVKSDNVELLEFCDELVHEMEEILLDSSVSSRSRFTHSDKPFQAQSPLPLRDGGSTASTSADDDTYPLNQKTHRIDGIEVVGAKQRKGDVSFSERLVGVKEYTVYVIRVQSGNDHWEVERRYRDFCTLHRRLKALFTAEGWVLPSPWSSVEKESRKIFGNVSPDVVRERSALIQDCLLSILYHQFSSTFPSALIWFLSPQKSLPSSPSSNIHDPQSPLSSSARTHSMMSFGKTLSLVVETRPYKSMKQILEAQHFICAGCHKHFDDGKTRMLEFVQTLGWGKPRLCEYTGQLFCSTCHTNETAVLPARVLHHWDFSLYPVSQMAKSYLDSIHDKPMLCVSAVNPFLFSKVPALQQVTSVRKRIGVMLSYVRCPFRMSIFRGLASRRYLLESNDFFALRDLIDLSKGAFAALPVIVDTVSRKILEHITEQCLVCCDVGIPCNARQACNDPSALIFPFQEGEVERCRSCKSVFHKLCFGKILNCPCGKSLRLDGQKGHRTKSELNSVTLDLFGKKSDSKSSMGFISGLFTKGKNEKFWGSKDADNVISMGSLPSSSL